MQLPGEFSPFIEKKVVFCLVVRPLKKPLFLCVSSLRKKFSFIQIFLNITSRERILAEFEKSLERLGVKYVDLIQVEFRQIFFIIFIYKK